MRFKVNVELELDAFNQDSAQRRVDDLLSKASLKKFQERNTEIKEVTYERIDKEDTAE